MKNIKSSIQPWLTVLNSKNAGEFYKEAFGAIETYRMESPDGGLVLRLAIGEAEFWVSGHSSDENENSKKNAADDIFKIILVVNDPDNIFKEAIKLGAKEIFPIGEDYGWRLGRLEDPFGFHWEIGKEL